MPTDRPGPDPAKLLEQWMAWEFAEVQPGQALANLKKGGLRELLEQLAGAVEGETAGAAGEKPAPAGEAQRD